MPFNLNGCEIITMTIYFEEYGTAEKIIIKIIDLWYQEQAFETKDSNFHKISRNSAGLNWNNMENRKTIHENIAAILNEKFDYPAYQKLSPIGKAHFRDMMANALFEVSKKADTEGRHYADGIKLTNETAAHFRGYNYIEKRNQKGIQYWTAGETNHPYVVALNFPELFLDKKELTDVMLTKAKLTNSKLIRDEGNDNFVRLIEKPKTALHWMRQFATNLMPKAEPEIVQTNKFSYGSSSD